MPVNFASAVIEWGSGDPVPSTTLLELMKLTLGIVDNSEDSTLSMFLEMSGNFAEKYIDDVLLQRQVIERFSHQSFPTVLRYSNVSSLDGVVVDEADKTSESSLYLEDAMGWVVNVGGYSTSCKFSQVNISYTAGYSPLPTDVGFAIVQGAIAYRTSAASGGVTGVIKKESVVGVGSVEYEIPSSSEGSSLGNLPTSVIGVLDLYSRIGA